MDAVTREDRIARWHEERRRREREKDFASSARVRTWTFIKMWRRLLHRTHFGARGVHIPPLDRALKSRTRDIAVQRRTLFFDSLPDAYDGYVIVHLSDMHFGTLDGLEDAVAAALQEIDADAVFITGDYIDDFASQPDEIRAPMQRVMDAATPRDGWFSVLGNHDGCRDVAVLEDLGIRVLINESLVLMRDGARLVLTGTDDPSYFYDDAQRDALLNAPDGFKIALVHSADLADYAAAGGHALYLSGHTHGGQICLPGGRPVLLDLHRFRDFGQGHWKFEKMQGITSHGAGASVIPYRINCPGEIGVLELRRLPSGNGPE